MESSKPVVKKRKIGAHWFIAAALLLVPLTAGVYCFMPRYYVFTALGDIVPVRDIGVEGNVHFVYVREGVAKNRYEKLSVTRAYPGATFEPADSSTREVMDMNLEWEKAMKNETIRHAVDSAAEVAGETVTEEARQEESDVLIEETSRYYGDSIGLMLGIGLVEQAESEDFSRGGAISIAGTGTLEADDTVGSVGAIRQKLITAEKAGADLFFVPKDKETYEYEGLSNEEEAEEAAQELRLRLRVVPVRDLEEAVAYLRQMN